jgi:hypothetical protein
MSANIRGYCWGQEEIEQVNKVAVLFRFQSVGRRSRRVIDVRAEVRSRSPSDLVTVGCG